MADVDETAWPEVLNLVRRAALTPRWGHGNEPAHGIFITMRAGSRPMALAGLPDYERGVAALALELVALARQSPEGRQALLNLGFEPVPEDVERPGSGGRNDA